MEQFDLVLPRPIIEYMRRLPDQQSQKVVSVLDAIATDAGVRELVSINDDEFSVASDDWSIIIYVDRDNHRLVVLSITPKTTSTSAANLSGRIP